MGKAALTAPLYISVAWSLIISYQLLTQAAVYSTITFVSDILPSAGDILFSRIDIVVFIHAFAWIFVLSSAIPSVILGKNRSVLLQFLICLTLTLVAFTLEEVLSDLMGATTNSQLQTLSSWFQNPLIAGLYLSVPYILMFSIDIHARRACRGDEFQENAMITEHVIGHEKAPLPECKNVPLTAETSQTKRTKEPVSDSPSLQNLSSRFLYGNGILCFLLALLTLWLDRLIFSTGLTSMSRLLYVGVFLVSGSLLISIGYYNTTDSGESD